MMRIPLLTIMLVGANVALAVLMGVKLVSGSQQQALLAAQARNLPEPVMQLDTPDLSANLESIQAAAVFHASRSFYVAPPQPVIVQPPPDYRLTGSMALPNRPAAALLLNNQTRASARVVVGDELEGWAVTEVSSRRVVLQRDGRTAELGVTAAAPANGMNLVNGTADAAANGAPSGTSNGMMWKQNK